MIHRYYTPDLRCLGTAKYVPLCDRPPWSGSSRPGRTEPDSRETCGRRQLQLSGQGWPEDPRRQSGVTRLSSHLETKSLIQDNVVEQHERWPVCPTQAGKRADIVSLRKHLGHTRRLASAIKRGQSYFHLLQKEEQEKQEEEERQRMRREEQLRTEPRPPSFSSDSDSEGWPLPTESSCSGVTVAWLCRKKIQSARPFTPLHHSLSSPLLSEAPRKLIYRQLCCLSWLLEALTLDRSGRVGPLTACWDPGDPGRGRTTIKMLKEERAIENKWEQFVSSKPCRAPPRRPRCSSSRLHSHRKSPFMSAASLSAVTPPTVGSSSVSSLLRDVGEDTESSGAQETGQSPSDYLCTLSDVHQKGKKESQSSKTSNWTPPESNPQSLKMDDQTGSKTTKSFPTESCPAISHLINDKATRLREIKTAFKGRVEEISRSYADVLELKARERLNSGLQGYRVPGHVTKSQGLPPHVTCLSRESEAPDNKNKNTHSNNMWLSSLLSSLPQEVCRERAGGRVLEKLRGFAEQQSLRVPPQVLLKVLGGLEPWELCLPELCVAVQIATEHVVQMPREEYDAWHGSRVTLLPQYRRAPQTPGDPHSLRP
ncbi:coiled-coil domain-containing protein 60-like [Pseudochaenichthys georgianus]|uniref:coiled-coil domain-containing protein 60-like n=1 Tax=Pseudochaenichthys georgianus TaxID=52239 RepID=UPI00146ADB0A|nr:coiled-coil domain-containing protein 60-like [Pseudochaenichthys georgianus]